MLTSHQVNEGRLLMTIFDFETTGDTLEAHTHDAVTSHYSIVAAGTLRMFGQGQSDQVLKSGSVVKIEPGQEHGFTAMTPRARLINVVYGENA